MKEHIQRDSSKLKDQIKSFIANNYINLERNTYNKYLENVDKLNINIVHVDIFEFPEKMRSPEQQNFIHKMKGNDDAVMTILLNELIKKDADIDVNILTKDITLFEDFINNQKFIPSFKVIIEKLNDDPLSEFYINFTNDAVPYEINASRLSILNSKKTIYTKSIINYNYNTSKLDSSGKYEVNNFYNYLTNKSYENISSDNLKQLETLESPILEPYIKDDKPNLNKYGMPYLDHNNGHIATLEAYPDIPYVSIIEYYERKKKGIKSLIRVEFIPAKQYTSASPYMDKKKIIELYLGKGKKYEYCYIKDGNYLPTLNEDGKPYIEHGKIFRLDIEMEHNGYTYNYTSVPYCYWANGKYHATLNLIGLDDYYKNAEGNNDNILIQNWQPWYNKYLKYKQKYLLLKKNYYLEK